MVTRRKTATNTEAVSAVSRSRTVTYRREQLVSTKQFENSRICIELVEEVGEGESAMEAYDRAKAFVDRKLLDELTTLKFGESEAVRLSQEARMREQRLSIAKTNNLMHVVD